jgi:hypothetical protein
MKTNLTLVVSKNCSACKRAQQKLVKIQSQKPSLNVKVVDINSFEDPRIAITPALLINDKLFSYGDIDASRLELKLK